MLPTAVDDDCQRKLERLLGNKPAGALSSPCCFLRGRKSITSARISLHHGFFDTTMEQTIYSRPNACPPSLSLEDETGEHQSLWIWSLIEEQRSTRREKRGRWPHPRDLSLQNALLSSLFCPKWKFQAFLPGRLCGIFGTRFYPWGTEIIRVLQASQGPVLGRLNLPVLVPFSKSWTRTGSDLRTG